MNLQEIADHKGVVGSAALGFVAAAYLVFNYYKSRAPKAADKMSPFSGPALRALRPRIDRLKTDRGVKPASERAPR